MQHHDATLRPLKPLSFAFDAIGNPVFVDYAEFRRWAQNRFSAQRLPGWIVSATDVEIAFSLLVGMGLNFERNVQSTWTARKDSAPGIRNDIALALAQRTGEFEWRKTTYYNAENDPIAPDQLSGVKVEAVRVEIKRRNVPNAVGYTFSMKMARQANLVRPGPWTQYPERMLEQRATGFALRSAFADALQGVPVKEYDEFIPADGEPQDAPIVERKKPGPKPGVPRAPRPNELRAAEERRAAKHGQDDEDVPPIPPLTRSG